MSQQLASNFKLATNCASTLQFEAFEVDCFKAEPVGYQWVAGSQGKARQAASWGADLFYDLEASTKPLANGIWNCYDIL